MLCLYAINQFSTVNMVSVIKFRTLVKMSSTIKMSNNHKISSIVFNRTSDFKISNIFLFRISNTIHFSLAFVQLNFGESINTIIYPRILVICI